MTRSGAIIITGKWHQIKAQLQARIAVEDSRQDVCSKSPGYTPGLSKEYVQ